MTARVLVLVLGAGALLSSVARSARAEEAPPAPDAPPPIKRWPSLVAFGADASVGFTLSRCTDLCPVENMPRSGTANALEIYGRYQLKQWLGVGMSFRRLASIDQYMGTVPFRFNDIGAHVMLQPGRGRRIDPFLRPGLWVVADATGARPTDGRLGVEAVAGLNVVLPHFALGGHFQLTGGDGNVWFMLGLQAEARI